MTLPRNLQRVSLITGENTNQSLIVPIGTSGQVLTVSGSQVEWKTASGGGGSLPTATAAGQTLLSTGAGTTYTAVDFGSQVSSSLGTIPSFDTGNGWSIVNTTGVVGSLPGGGIARFTATAAAGAQNDFTAARIERPWDFIGGNNFHLKVTPIAQTSSVTGYMYPALFIRDATNILQFLWAPAVNLVFAGAWASPGLQPPGFLTKTFTLNGKDSFDIRIAFTGGSYPNAMFYCVSDSTKLPFQVYTHTLNFAPTHFGVSLPLDGTFTGQMDFGNISLTSY